RLLREDNAMAPSRDLVTIDKLAADARRWRVLVGLNFRADTRKQRSKPPAKHTSSTSRLRSPAPGACPPGPAWVTAMCDGAQFGRDVVAAVKHLVGQKLDGRIAELVGPKPQARVQTHPAHACLCRAGKAARGREQARYRYGSLSALKAAPA